MFSLIFGRDFKLRILNASVASSKIVIIIIKLLLDSLVISKIKIHFIITGIIFSSYFYLETVCDSPMTALSTLYNHLISLLFLIQNVHKHGKATNR